jgi:hypothetical protein
MINPHHVAQLLSNLVSQQLSLNDHDTAVSDRDREVAQGLYDQIESILESTHYSFETEHSVDFNDQSNAEQSDDNDDEEDQDQDDEEEGDDEQQQEIDDNDEALMEMEVDQQNTLFHRFSIEYMRKAIDFYDAINQKTGKKQHSWKAFQHRFRKVKNRKYIERFRKYLESGGTKQEKLDEIDQFTYNKFEKARSEFLFVHDVDLKRWALQKAREIDDKTFKASDNWVVQFKNRHALCSRKVTKLVTQREVLNSDTINDSAKNFVANIKTLLSYYRQSNVLNTDQSGVQIEMVGNRTLSFKGEKNTFGKVRSLFNTSHSYTVQFIVSLAGQPVGPCYLCLKEKNGRMSENIKTNLFQAANVIVTCSESGKLSSSLVKYWIDKVLRPVVRDKKVLLLLDIWGGQTDQQLYSQMKHLRIEVIPKKTTAMIQPLDITFNRQYKRIVRTIFDHVRLHDLDCNLSERNNIIKLTSLCYNQLCSKKFFLMNQYSWFKGGYLETHPGSYQNVEETCFRFQDYCCQEKKCNSIPLIQCSFCENVLCFYHFFVLYHIH